MIAESYRKLSLLSLISVAGWNQIKWPVIKIGLMGEMKKQHIWNLNQELGYLSPLHYLWLEVKFDVMSTIVSLVRHSLYSWKMIEQSSRHAHNIYGIRIMDKMCFLQQW